MKEKAESEKSPAMQSGQATSMSSGVTTATVWDARGNGKMGPVRMSHAGTLCVIIIACILDCMT